MGGFFTWGLAEFQVTYQYHVQLHTVQQVRCVVLQNPSGSYIVGPVETAVVSLSSQVVRGHILYTSRPPALLICTPDVPQMYPKCTLTTKVLGHMVK